MSSAVRPGSPVFLHVGGVVDFRVESTEDLGSSYPSDHQSSFDRSSMRWSTSDSSTLDIDAKSGRGEGRQEGKAEVMLSQHTNTASIVHISKVTYAQVDPRYPLLINTDADGSMIGDSPEIKVRVKFFLAKQNDEVMPTVQFDGITLISQNVGIRCESDNPSLVHAEGVVSELEGYFCAVRYRKAASSAGMPRFVRIYVTATGASSSGR